MEREHSHSKPGRRGDPRMNRAVAARLANSELSLYEALKAGGFDWSVSADSSDSAKDKDKVFDSDGVSLSQRKNQLNRRLRQHKKKVTEEKSIMDHELVKNSRSRQDVQEKDSALEVLPYASTDNTINDSNDLRHVPQETNLLQPVQGSPYAASSYVEIQDTMNQKIPYSDMKRTFSLVDGVVEKNTGMMNLYSTDSEQKDTALSRQWGEYSKDVNMADSSQSADFSLRETEFSTASPSKQDGTPIAPEIFHSDGQCKSEDITFDAYSAQDPNVPKISEEERKMKKAIDLFHVKNSILLKRCLLTADFPPDQVMEGSDTFHNFADLATKEVLDTAWLNMMHSGGREDQEPFDDINRIK